jgi:hypothetical protein
LALSAVKKLNEKFDLAGKLLLVGPNYPSGVKPAVVKR